MLRKTELWTSPNEVMVDDNRDLSEGCINCRANQIKEHLSFKSIPFTLIKSEDLTEGGDLGSMQSLKKRIAPRYADYFFALSKRAFIYSRTNKCEFSLSVCAPMNLFEIGPVFACITVDILHSKLQVSINPLRYGEEDLFWFDVFKDGTFDFQIKEFLVNSTPDPDLGFTSRQTRVFNLLLSSMSSSEICSSLNMKIDNLYKYFNRIRIKLSDFFERDFDDIHQSISFYLERFPRK